MDPRTSLLQSVFKRNINQSFLQIQHNKINKTTEDKKEMQIQEENIQQKVDMNTIRLTMVFDSPTTFNTIKKDGYLYTKSEKKGFWSFCVCSSNSKKSQRVTINNRVLAVRGKDDRIIETVNFDTVSVEVKQASNSVTIFVKNSQKEKGKIYLQAPPQQDIQEWVQLINRGIQGSQGDIYNLYFLASLPNFLNTLSIPEKQFSKNCNSGDILLFKSSHSLAKVQRDLTGSEYDHIALVLKNSKNEVLLFESNSDTGVALSFWKDMIQFKWYEATERKLNTKRNELFVSKLQEFVSDNLDKKFQVSLKKLLTFQSKVLTKAESDKRTYFCSELVAKCFKDLGLLSNSKSSTQYWPIDFTEDRTLDLIGAQFGPQQIICFDRQLCNSTQ